MIDEIRKSINAILYERVSSPFYGTLALSWLAWNWKIPYITFFVSEAKINCSNVLFTNCSKVDYILEHCTNSLNLWQGPLISVVVLLAVVPFITNGSYWLDMWFKKWRIKKKIEFEDETPLLPKKANELRKKIRDVNEEFERLNEEKDEGIKDLKSLNSELTNKNNLLNKSLKEKETKLNQTENTVEQQKNGQRIVIEENQELKKEIENKNKEINEVQHELNEREKDVNFLNKKDHKANISDLPPSNITKVDLTKETEYKRYLNSGKIEGFSKKAYLFSRNKQVPTIEIQDLTDAIKFSLIEYTDHTKQYVQLTTRGENYLKWYQQRESSLFK